MTDNTDKFAEILLVESEAIRFAAERLDRAAAASAVALVVGCEGKVIVTGVGKSGIIANKIAQTLTSTGTVAVFVHPSDALHGSLGVISKGDVVIALSNSGETDEILALLPALESRGVSLISIVGNVDSALSRRSDVVLDASVDKEACPLNLAPTTSTTVGLAIGDALAMAVMAERGLTEEDFAANHPGGRLGKRLTLRVNGLMHESPNVATGAGWMDIIRSLSNFGLGAVNVVDEEGCLLGIITDGDLRRTLEKVSTANLEGLKADEMMTGSPVTASPEMLAYDALRLMEDRPSQISVLPVVDEGGRCVGLIRLHDLVKSGL